MRELDKVLNTNEKILWEGSPSFWPFLLGRSLLVTIFGSIWLVMVLFVVFKTQVSNKYIIFLMPHFWIGIFITFGPTIYHLLVFKYTNYAITDKRVIIQKGWIARSFETVDFDKITNTEVSVGVFDKLFGGNTGSILISTANTTYTAGNILNPYDVYKFFEKVEHDVKTDVEYPNKIRPSENKGYQTDYNPNKK